nr:PREDICTED: caspase-7-like [Lepisosteus oculatus]
MPFLRTRKPLTCNKAVLVSVTKFDPGVDLDIRNGARRDTKRLHKILSRLGFQVDIHNDLSANEIQQVFKTASTEPVDNCFVGVLSSHGEEGLIFGADGAAVRLADIFGWFGNPVMAEKTKVFFVQACRGTDLDSGVELQTDSPELSQEEDSFSHCHAIPINCAVTFATSPGYSAFLHPLGSVFIQTLCDLLEEEGGKNLEINQLLTRLNYRVAYSFEARGRDLGGKKVMPCFVTRLTREVFPFADRAQHPQALKYGTEQD